MTPSDKALVELLELISRKHHQSLYFNALTDYPFDDSVDELILILAHVLDLEIQIGGNDDDQR